MSTETLNSLVHSVTAFKTFAELQTATAGGYVPTLPGGTKTKTQRFQTVLAEQLEQRGIRVFRGCR